MPRVVVILVKVNPVMTIKKADKITYQAHSKGQVVVNSCHKELAELYEYRSRDKGLASAPSRPARCEHRHS